MPNLTKETVNKNYLLLYTFYSDVLLCLSLLYLKIFASINYINMYIKSLIIILLSNHIYAVYKNPNDQLIRTLFTQHTFKAQLFYRHRKFCH